MIIILFGFYEHNFFREQFFLQLFNITRKKKKEKKK